MARVPNQFVDPTGVVATYNWPINHDSETPRGRKRTISQTAPTGDLGSTAPVRQMGANMPLQLILTGTILTEAQRNAFIQWWEMCDEQTIYFYEFNGEQYEVLIIDFEEQKHISIWNSNDITNAPHHYYTYTLTMDVITVLAGSWLQSNP